MNGNILSRSIVLLPLFTCLSCIDDDETYVSYGVIQNVSSNDDYEILTDEGNTLEVTKSNTAQAIENEKRVLVNFEILSDKNKGASRYEVLVNGFYNLLSKPVVRESFIRQDEAARRDSIGDDPFVGVNAWFGGNYVNIDFEVYHLNNSSVKHMLNLVYDDTRADADTLYLSLFHNAYNELPANYADMYRGVGRCSFKISDLLPSGTASRAVKLSWKQYAAHSRNEVENVSDSGVFRLGGNTASKMSGRNIDAGIEMK